MKRLVAIGKEAYGLYILDKGLVQEVKFGKNSYLVYSKQFSYNDSNINVSCNETSRQLSFDV